MTDFSKSSAMPRPKPPQNLADVIETIDKLSSLATKLFLPLVDNLLQGARRFAVQLQLSCVRFDSAMLVEFCLWIDNRLEVFKCHVAQNDLPSAKLAVKNFSAVHPSYVQIVQSATNHQLAELQSARSAGVSGSQQCSLNRDSSKPDPGMVVPKEVLRTLPIENGKSLCMKYLSN